jgi:tetratricopeptide (TPR) repeat protein
MKGIGLVVALLGAAGARAEAPESPLLTEAKAAYRQFDYEKCVARLEHAEKSPLTAADQVEVALYEGVCHFYLGHSVAAQAAFERALRLNPQARLPAFSSPKIVGLFSEIAATMPPPAPAPPLAPAPTESPVAPPPAPAPTPEPAPLPEVMAAPPPVAERPAIDAPTRVVETVPPATSHNHWLVPTLGGIAVAAAGAGGILGAEALRYQNDANANFQSDLFHYAHASRNAALGANVCYAAAGTALAAALVTWAIQGFPMPGDP